MIIQNNVKWRWRSINCSMSNNVNTDPCEVVVFHLCEQVHLTDSIWATVLRRSNLYRRHTTQFECCSYWCMMQYSRWDCLIRKNRMFILCCFMRAVEFKKCEHFKLCFVLFQFWTILEDPHTHLEYANTNHNNNNNATLKKLLQTSKDIPEKHCDPFVACRVLEIVLRWSAKWRS